MSEFDMEHERRLTEVEQLTKNNCCLIVDLQQKQQSINDLVVSIKELTIREENVESTVKEIKEDVRTLTSKSGKRWDNVIEQLITIVVAALVGIIIAKIKM